MTYRSQSTDLLWLKVPIGFVVTLILTMIIISSNTYALRNNKYYVQNVAHNDGFSSNDQLAIIEAESKMMCLMLCNHNEQCQSISYNPDTMTCQHFLVPLWDRPVTETYESGYLHYDLFKGWDCQDLKERQYLTGIYTICPGNSACFSAKCEMNEHGGGWTVIQHRYDGTVNFQRSWLDYKMGFGNLQGEFWLGNDEIHAITTSANCELRVDIGDWAGNNWYAIYRTFRVEDENSKYKLTIGDYSGTAGDSMILHRGMFFSTTDVDNDISPTMHCSNKYGGGGGWWYYACDKASLNGQHAEGSKSDGINWYNAKNSYYSFKLTRMMIRRL